MHDRYFEVTDAFSNPKPVQQPHIPLWIGGSGEQLTLRVVAEFADGWNTFLGPIDTYRRKLDVLAGHCREVGRDPNDLRSASDASRRLQQRQGRKRLRPYGT